MRFFITGGCGFLGSNLAAELMRRGEDVSLFDNLSRTGAEENLAWLRRLGKVRFSAGDVRRTSEVSSAVRDSAPDVVFHLAAQVAMTTSLRDPRLDFETNALGSFNVLEAVRTFAPEATVVYASSNKVYGDLAHLRLTEGATRYSPTGGQAANAGIDESLALDFRSPYGCSKGAADQYMLDYARNYGTNTVVFRHSTIYGERQFATEDQGWVGWFCRQGLEARGDPERSRFTICGNGKQVRDLLHVSDAVECYLAAVRLVARARGEAFNIGGGMANSLSLLELFAYLEERLGTALAFTALDERQSDQRFFVADTSKALRVLGWAPVVRATDGIARILDRHSAGVPLAVRAQRA